MMGITTMLCECPVRVRQTKQEGICVIYMCWHVRKTWHGIDQLLQCAYFPDMDVDGQTLMNGFKWNYLK